MYIGTIFVVDLVHNRFNSVQKERSILEIPLASPRLNLIYSQKGIKETNRFWASAQFF